MPEESWRGTRNDNRSGINIYNLGKTSYILLATFAGLALGVAVFSIYTASLAERETRMLEYYIMENDHKLVNARIIKPDETWSARKDKQEK